MKTTDPARYYRNQTTHAARLARWQECPAPARLARLRNLPAYAGETLAQRRAYSLANHDDGPELSSPEADAPLLWIENPDRSALIRNHWKSRDFLRHRGWYTMDDGADGETLEAYAVQLEAFPHLIFEAVFSSCNDTLRVMLDEFHTIDYSEAEGEYSAENCRESAAREAIHSADSTAEREAEEERDYQREEDRKYQAEEAREELAANRATVRALIRDLRALCPSDIPTTYPAAAQAVRDQLAALMRDRRDTLDNIRNLTA